MLVAQQQQTADLIVTNAHVYTADVNRPMATALAVRGDRILFVGSDRGAEALAGPRTQRLDLAGKTVIPGMVDAHTHLLGLGQALRTVDLVGTRSYDEVIARVVERAKSVPPGQWIRGRGWDQNDWAVTTFPTHDALSKAVPNNPVWLGRVDGHAALANAKAMELAGVTARTPDPEGGRIIRDARGNPTGVFVDRARGVVERVMTGDSPDETKAETLAAIADTNHWASRAFTTRASPRATSRSTRSWRARVSTTCATTSWSGPMRRRSTA